MESLEFLSKWSGIAAVWLTALAALTGLVAWHFFSRLADLKDAALEKF